MHRVCVACLPRHAAAVLHTYLLAYLQGLPWEGGDDAGLTVGAISLQLKLEHLEVAMAAMEATRAQVLTLTRRAGHLGLQARCLGLQAGCPGLQDGCPGLQAGCVGLKAGFLVCRPVAWAACGVHRAVPPD